MGCAKTASLILLEQDDSLYRFLHATSILESMSDGCPFASNRNPALHSIRHLDCRLHAFRRDHPQQRRHRQAWMVGQVLMRRYLQGLCYVCP
jgi:hypothetical protein